jgi:hypothetical protein
MVTARVAIENRARCFAVGADDYVPKPYTPDQIFRAMENAAAWSCRVADGDGAPEVIFRAKDEIETLRDLSRLRGLLLAHTELDTGTACRLHEAFHQLAAAAHDWGREHGASEVAALSMTRTADRLEFQLRDLSGWFREDPRAPAARWAEAVARVEFDSIESAPRGDVVSFVYRIPDT